MPALKNDAKLTISSTLLQQSAEIFQTEEAPNPDSNPTTITESSNSNQNQVQIIREITQTDKLNKALSKAFLNRMNNGEFDRTFQEFGVDNKSSLDSNQNFE